MAGDISFGGLVSGLDTKDIINKLVAVKQARQLKPVTDKIAKLQTEGVALSPILTLFNSLRDVAKTLSDPSSSVFSTKSATSSDTDSVGITAVLSSKAVAGTYNVTEVSQLAQADRVVFNGVANKATSTFGTGTFTITYKGATTSVAVTSGNATLEGIVGAINSADAGVTASIINDGGANPYRLVLTAETTGADTAITHTIDSVLTLTVDAVASSTSANQPFSAAFKVNGISMTSKTNTVSEAIQGVTLNLLAVNTTTTTTVTVKSSTTALAAKISGFVTAFNTARSGLRGAILPNKDTGKFGPLGHDATLSSAFVNISRGMGKQMTSLTGYSYTNLVQIGITSDANGDLQVDSSKLSSALENNLSSVEKLFQGTTAEDGIAETVYDEIYNMTAPNGVFDKRSKLRVQQLEDLDKRGKSLADLIESYKTKLTKQFNRLEKVLQGLKSQEAQLGSYTSIYENSSNKLL